MPTRLAAFLTGLLITITAFAASTTDDLLRRIDSIIPHKQQFEHERRLGIDTMSAILPTVDNDGDRYNIYRSIYGRYRSYRNDSALIIADKRLAVARRLGQPSKILSASLNLAESFAACGNYHEALEILDTLNRRQMEEHHRRYLYSIYGKVYRQLSIEDAISSRKLFFKDKEKAYRDSSLTTYNEDDPSYYYLKAWQLMDAGQWQEALNLMEQTEKRFGSIEDNAPILAQKALIYHNLGHGELEKQYLARAALIDLKGGVKDYTSLMDLAIHLNAEGDHDRAYEYLRCALDDALFCNAKSRSSQILNVIPVINSAYTHAERQRRVQLWAFVFIAVLLAVGLAIALRVARVSLKNNRKTSDTLRDSDNAKSAYINELFDDYSNYIERISAYRKRLKMFLKVGKTQELKDLIDSDRIEADELKDLYAKFDRIFLSMHPTFIADYNSMVRPEARIDESSKTLTSALRVVALMKLGITSTRSISAMLHYTPQTVYNYRNKIKSVLVVSLSEFNARIGIQEEISAE